MNLNKYIGVLAVFAGLLAVAPLTTARADQPGTTAPTFASVDIEQVLQNSKLSTRVSDTMTTFTTKLKANFTKLTEGSAVFLSDAEASELDGLYDKETPTDADKKRTADLVALGDSRKNQMTTLENTANPTEEQRKQFRDLTGMRDHGAGRKEAFGQAFQSRAHDRNQELLQQAVKDIKAATAEVAKSKSISVVFDSSVAVYTSNDITPDVIKQVNK